VPLLFVLICAALENPQALFARAQRAFRLKQYPEAAALFERAAAESQRPEQYVNAGLSWLKARQPHKAMAAYSKAMVSGRLKPQLSAELVERMKTLRAQTAEVELETEPGCEIHFGSEPLAAPRTWHAPGVYVVTTTCPPEEERREAVTLVGGELRRITAKRTSVALRDEVVSDAPARDVEEVPPASEPPPIATLKPVTSVRPSQPPELLAGALICGGLSIGALVASAVLWLRVEDTFARFTAPGQPRPTLAMLSDQGFAQQTAHHVTLGVGLTLGTAAVTLLLIRWLGIPESIP
jgi:hypothetical protein